MRYPGRTLVVGFVVPGIRWAADVRRAGDWQSHAGPKCGLMCDEVRRSAEDWSDQHIHTSGTFTKYPGPFPNHFLSQRRCHQLEIGKQQKRGSDPMSQWRFIENGTGFQEREKSPIHEAYAEGQSIGAKVKLGTDWRNHWIHRNHWIYKGFGRI